MKIVMIFYMLLLTYTILCGATLQVPEEYPTIQEAINAAEDDDIVFVAPGIYYEHLICDEKSIEICSWYDSSSDTSYVSQTIIDGSNSGRVITLPYSNAGQVRICGFTIRNGNASNGGGIYMTNNDVLLEVLLIQNNTCSDSGGGIYCQCSSQLEIENVVIRNNHAGNDGGGICLREPGFDIDLYNVEIYGNTSGRDGGGIYGYISMGGDWVYTRIHDNHAENMGGGIAMHNGHSNLSNMQIYGNTAERGGGIYLDFGSYPDLEHVKVYDNLAFQGGGIYMKDSSPDLFLVQVKENESEMGGGIYMNNSSPDFDFNDRCSVYLNRISERGCGSDMYSENHVVVYLDTCTVLYPTSYHMSPRSNFTVDVIHQMRWQVETDLYVSPDGDNSFGGQIPSAPLRTIEYAASIILADSDNPLTIHIAEGIYSPSTNGEHFPVYVPDYVHFMGESAENVILNAEDTGGCFKLYNVTGTAISNMTLTGGNASVGGGIWSHSSDVSINNLKIIDNCADTRGGAIYAWESQLELSNMIIKDNYGDKGGGIYSYNSSIALSAVSLRENHALVEGGGMYLTFDTELDMDAVHRSSIYLNSTGDRGLGNDIYSTTTCMHVIVDTFTVINPTVYHLNPLDHFYWDIHHGVEEQISSNLYIAPDGDDENAGISAESPFKTITHACSVILASSTNPLTIFLANGVYSNSATGEIMPICLPDYVTLYGESESGTILDGENNHRIFLCIGDSSTVIKNLTVCGGYAHSGGGVCISSSGVTFEDVTISNCHATHSGGGIWVGNYTTQHFKNITLENNSSDVYGGGVSCTFSTDCVFENLIARNNTAEKGGALRFSYTNSVLVDTFIIENNSATEDGGAISCEGTYNLKNGIIRNNSAALNGGGIAGYRNMNASLNNVKLLRNCAGVNGGGLYSNNDGDSLSFINCLIAENTATQNGGGLYIRNAVKANILNSTISGNNAQTEGDGIYFCDIGHSHLINSIIWDNQPQEIVFYQDDYPANLYLGYSCISDIENYILLFEEAYLVILDGNIEGDPVFYDQVEGSYLLSSSSPCIDAGTAFFENNGQLLIDMEEDDYYGIAPDMGAYEYGMVKTDESSIENLKCNIWNYPNPFNPDTHIIYNIDNDGKIKLGIYNTKGQHVIDLVDENRAAGEYQTYWNGKDKYGYSVSSGLYFLLLKYNQSSTCKKLLLIK